MWFAGQGIEIDWKRGPLLVDTAIGVQAAVAGKGVALVRRSLIGDELAAERLVAPLPQGLSKGMAYHLVYLPENMAQPAVRAFRAWLLEAVAEHGARIGAHFVNAFLTNHQPRLAWRGMPMRWLSVATDWVFESGRRVFLVCLLAGLAVLWLSIDYDRLIHGSSSMKPVNLFLQNAGGAGIEFAIPLAYFQPTKTAAAVTAVV